MTKILITGGTGFLGQELMKRLPQEQVRIVARNEKNLIDLKTQYPSIEIIPGDIREELICQKALQDVDTVFHLSAFKHVGLAEENVHTCIGSNLTGTMNLLKYFSGQTFVFTSTDKACKINGVYGASKFLAERAITEYSNLHPDKTVRIVRYGNVLWSSGSVLPKWKELLQQGKEVIITDPEATRFFWTVQEAVDLIFEAIIHGKDATPYCPTMKSIKMGDLLEAMQQKYGRAKNVKVIGLQGGENKSEKVVEGSLDSEESEKFGVDEIMDLI